jgi:hypothetical protein
MRWKARYGGLWNSPPFDLGLIRREIRTGSKESRSLARKGLVELEQRTVAGVGIGQEYCIRQFSLSK